MAASFGFEPLPASVNVFPLNVHLAYKAAVEIVNPKIDGYLEIAEIDGRVRLVTAAQLDTGLHLYQIPLRPIYRLGRDRSHRREYLLLMSVLAYLCQVVSLPNFRDGYMGGCYEMIGEMLCDMEGEYSEGELRGIVDEFVQVRNEGYHMLDLINDSSHLPRWQGRLKRLKPVTALQREIHKVASNFFALYKQYPQRTYHDNVFDGFLLPSEEYRTLANEYISIIWPEDGWLYEQAVDYFESNRQEDVVQEEPLYLHVYDCPFPAPKDNLDFEIRLFDYLLDLEDILFKLL